MLKLANLYFLGAIIWLTAFITLLAGAFSYDEIKTIANIAKPKYLLYIGILSTFCAFGFLYCSAVAKRLYKKSE